MEGEGNEEMLNCVGGRSFRSVRERWWYIALSKCGVSGDTVNNILGTRNVPEADYCIQEGMINDHRMNNLMYRNIQNYKEKN